MICKYCGSQMTEGQRCESCGSLAPGTKVKNVEKVEAGANMQEAQSTAKVKPTIRIIAAVAAFVVLIPLILWMAGAFGNSPFGGSHEDTNVNLTNYNQIQIGMTYEEVCQIMAGPGELTYSSDVIHQTRWYEWRADSGVNEKYISVIFQNNNVFSKSKFNL